MPRVDLYRDKYIVSDAVHFIEGKTKQEGKRDKDIAELISISPPAYCLRKKNGKLDLSYLELVKVIDYLNLSDEEIVKLMRGKIKSA